MSDLRKRIEERAYELYLQRGGKNGDALSDWLRAEKEIMGEAKEAKTDLKEAKKPARKKKKSGG